MAPDALPFERGGGCASDAALYDALEVESGRGGAGDVTPRAPPPVVSELAVFRAVLAKNWALKWRGLIACCSGAQPAGVHAGRVRG
jgi:hypothetical protein